MSSVTCNLGGDNFIYLEGGTFGHNEKLYSLSAILLMVHSTPTLSLPINLLDWILSEETEEPENEKENRILLADIEIPIIVIATRSNGWVVVDGIHRLAKIKRLFDEGKHDARVKVKVLKRLPKEEESLMGQGAYLIATSNDIDESKKVDFLRKVITTTNQMAPGFR